MEKAAKVENLLSGRCMRTMSKVLKWDDSEDEVHNVVNRLLACVGFRNQTKCLDALTKEETACLRSFFYCVLRLSARPPAWMPEIKGNIQDILTFARQMDYPRKADLHFEELYVAGGASGFWGWMDELYELLAGLPVTSRISAADEQPVRTEHWETIAVMNPENLDADFDQGAWELEQQDGEEWLMEDPEYVHAKQRRQDWVQEFPEPQPFCQSYLLLRKLYFDTRLQNTLPQLVEQALDIFLQDWHESYFLDDSAFTCASKLLDDAVEQLDRLLLSRLSV